MMAVWKIKLHGNASNIITTHGTMSVSRLYWGRAISQFDHPNHNAHKLNATNPNWVTRQKFNFFILRIRLLLAFL